MGGLSMTRIVLGTALGDLLDLAEDCRLRVALLYQLTKALFSEVGADAGMACMSPKGGQHPFRQLEDLEDAGNAGRCQELVSKPFEGRVLPLRHPTSSSPRRTIAVVGSGRCGGPGSASPALQGF